VKSFKFFLGLGCIMVIWSINGIADPPVRYGFSYVIVAIFAGVLVYLASLETGWILDVPILRNILEYIGSRSYGIYLGHFAFIRLKPTLLKLYDANLPSWVKISHRGLFLQDTLVWIGLLIICEMLFWLIEQPFINMGKAFIKSRIVPDKFSTARAKLVQTLSQNLVVEINN
jgi:peptidoglycan/LPS O-acetylase OafA/YrhL